MKSYKTFLFLGVFIIIVLVGLYIFLPKSIDIKDEKVLRLYNYLGSNDLSICKGLINYQDKIISYDDLDNSTRLCVAYSNLNEKSIKELAIDKNKKKGNCLIGKDIYFGIKSVEDDMCFLNKFSKDDISLEYKKIYGKDINNFVSFEIDENTICHFYNDNYYLNYQYNL